MKAGILTFHDADNYGAVLQAWALQQTLKKLGVQSEFISVEAPAPKASPPAASRGAALFEEHMREEREKRASLFKQFRRSHLICSPVYAKDELKKTDKEYDLFIAGSDQIWNYRIPGADERFFLPFAAPEKRFSYAASFGMEELPERVKPWCADRLRRFAGISVREESGRRIVYELTGRDAAVSLDPTLLLSQADWETMICPTEKDRYLLLFMLKFDGALAAGAREAAEKSGFELKTVTAAYMPQCGFACWNEVGVEDWIGLIAGASGVYTNSFHCTALSLLFGKSVSVAGLQGELSGRNGRIEELLKLAGCESTLNGSLCFPGEGVFEDRIRRIKENSLQYLKDIINNAGSL